MTQETSQLEWQQTDVASVGCNYYLWPSYHLSFIHVDLLNAIHCISLGYLWSSPAQVSGLLWVLGTVEIRIKIPTTATRCSLNV